MQPDIRVIKFTSCSLKLLKVNGKLVKSFVGRDSLVEALTTARSVERQIYNHENQRRKQMGRDPVSRPNVDIVKLEQAGV